MSVFDVKIICAINDAFPTTFSGSGKESYVFRVASIDPSHEPLFLRNLAVSASIAIRVISVSKVFRASTNIGRWRSRKRARRISKPV